MVVLKFIHEYFHIDIYLIIINDQSETIINIKLSSLVYLFRTANFIIVFLKKKKTYTCLYHMNNTLRVILLFLRITTSVILLAVSRMQEMYKDFLKVCV